ncbi:hypothetical protein Q083_02447 [Pseudomonas aeruginosa M8A.4]|nr:hypothetical protein Q083_02447 [Pseudomonas aeruginosa M8A.4]
MESPYSLPCNFPIPSLVFLVRELHLVQLVQLLLDRFASLQGMI